MGCNFVKPYYHEAPVHHGGAQLVMHEWPDECVWAQLQYERWQQRTRGDGYTGAAYLVNLEQEWASRGICSRCRRDIDAGLDSQMDELEAREHDIADRLGRIRRLMATTPDNELRPAIMAILDAQ